MLRIIVHSRALVKDLAQDRHFLSRLLNRMVQKLPRGAIPTLPAYLSPSKGNFAHAPYQTDRPDTLHHDDLSRACSGGNPNVDDQNQETVLGTICQPKAND